MQPVVATNRSGVIFERGGGRRTIIEQVFGDDRKFQERRKLREREYYGNDEQYPGSRNPRGGTFRTLCVRTCDGYYFPISFSTSPSGFDRDTNACRAKCPGTETQLYFHAARGEDSEDMISADTQEPYSSLENAFKYRQIVSRGCGCKFTQPGHSILAGDGTVIDRNIDPANPETFVATPIFRTDRGEDPETQANLRGLFVPEVQNPEVASKAKPALDKRKIRIVGEAFFPAQ